MRYQPGDVVRVRNARNRIGVYQIASDHEWYYKVYVLKFIELPLAGSDMFPNMQMHPKQFLKKAAVDPSLFKQAKFERTHLTSKAAHNINEKLPVDATQVLH
jgi:hypothetical protein